MTREQVDRWMQNAYWRGIALGLATAAGWAIWGWPSGALGLMLGFFLMPELPKHTPERGDDAGAGAD